VTIQYPLLSHRYAGILSAYGMALADVVHECQEPSAATYSKGTFNFVYVETI